MEKAIKALIMVPAAMLGLAALASCDKGSEGGGGSADKAAASAEPSKPPQLFADDFKGVCSGASVSRSTAYAAGGKAHKALYFETYKDGYTDRSSSLPQDWTVQFSPDSDAYAAIDLVACAKRTADHEVKICDGYKNDGKPTQNKVRWHTATYLLSVMEAKTGKKLAETTLEATDTDCPMFMNFDGDSDTVDDYASPSDAAVAEFLKAHIAQ